MNNKALSATSIIILSVLVAISAIMVGVTTDNFVYPVFIVILIIAFVPSRISSLKKGIMRQFETSPTLRGKHTIRTYNDGLEILNSYEKMFVPWQSIYCVKSTDTHLIILPTYQKGVIAINKGKYGGAELDAVICEICKNVKIEEGRQ